MMFLCCFGLFYTVCNFPIPEQQTQDSAGKSGCWVAEEEHLQITWKLTGRVFQKNNEDTQKGSQRGATGCPGGLGAPPWPRRGGAWSPWPTSGRPLLHICSPSSENPRHGTFYGVPPPLRGGNLQRRKGHLRRVDSAGEITSRKGRSSPSSSPSSRASSRSSSTSSPTPAPSPSSSKSHLSIATRVVTCTTYPLYSIGVDYYFVVNAIEFCWRNIIMSRLFITYLSPLMMISFMSRE